MNWTKFISWVLGLYALYYVLNILWDVWRAQRLPGGTVTEELYFEAPEPQRVTAEEPAKTVAKVKGEPATSAIGGVNLKDLFNLAKAEVIAYNRAVTF